MEELVRTAREAYRQDQVRRTHRIEFRVPTERGEISDHFVHTVVPTHESTGKVAGVVIYTENVTESDERDERENQPCA